MAEMRNVTVVGRPRSRKDEAYATESWWTKATPERFTALAQHEVQRMSNSRLANGVDSVHGLHELQHRGKGRPRKNG